MTTPYLSEVRIMSFNFAPKGWAQCNGQLLPINQNQALFSLLGTTYGGDGGVNFGLPNMQGLTPMHMGSGHTLGERGGEQAHTLSISEIPTHVHSAQGTSDNTAPVEVAQNNVFGPSSVAMYGPPRDLTSLNPATLASIGGSQAPLNMQPFLVLGFCIA